MKASAAAGFSLLELLIGVAISIIVVLGIRGILLRSQESGMRSSLKKNQSEIAKNITKSINYHYLRHIAKAISNGRLLTLSLPSGVVSYETVCVANVIPSHAPNGQLNRCLTCPVGQRQVIQIKSKTGTQHFPSLQQRADLPAGASMCFTQGADPSEVELLVEYLLVDPVNPQDRKLTKTESILVKEVSKFTSFE